MDDLLKLSGRISGMTILTEVYAALIIGMFALVTRISFSVFIFSGSLSPYLFDGLTFIITSAAVALVITSLLTKITTNIALPASATLPMFGAISVSLATLLFANGQNQNVFSTVLVGMSVATFITGTVFFILGRFKWGNFVRFIPFPLIAGFLSSSGWLILTEAIKILMGPRLSVAIHLPTNLLLIKTVPVLFYVTGVLIAQRIFKGNLLIVLGMIIVSTAIFYLMLSLNHFSMSDARAYGFLFAPTQPKSLFRGLHAFSFAMVNWKIILGQFWNIIIIVVVSILAFLFNAAGIGLVMSRDIKFNRELRVAGLANVLSSFGGMVVFMSAPATIANYKLQIKSRRVPWMIAVIFISLLIWPSLFFEYIPKPIVVGFLIPTGLSLLKDWGYDVWKIMPLSDYLLVLTVLAITAIFGLLNGVFVGLVIAMTLFAFKYAKLNIVDYQLSGENVHSNVQRSHETQQFLADNGSFLIFFKLQNYIFFGTANVFLQHIKAEIKKSSLQLKYVILDFAEVSGMDTSAVFSFKLLNELFKKNNLILVVTNLKPEMYKQLEQSGFITSDNVKVFANSDYAVQWCQDEFLKKNNIHDQQRIPLTSYLQQFFANPVDAQRIAGFFEKVHLHAGSYLFKAGDIASDLYYLEFGLLTIEGPAGDETQISRYYTLGPGNIIGEMATYLQAIRTAPARAETNCILQKLSFEKIHAIERDNPELAYEFHRFMAKIIAEKLVHMNKYVQTLLR